MKKHKLTVKFTAAYPDIEGKVLHLARTYIRPTRRECNTESANFFADLGKAGFIVTAVTREDEQLEGP